MIHTLSDKQKIYNLERKLAKCEQMIKVLQLATCTAHDSTREKLLAADILTDQFPVHVVCDALNLSRGTYYNHKLRNKNDQAWFLLRDKVLNEKILETFNNHEQRIGSEKIAALISQSGMPVTAEKVSALMKALDIHSIRSDSKKLHKRQAEKAKNLIQQNFTASAPNQVWLSDVTEFHFKSHKYYICVVEDIFSRRVVGLKISHRNSTHLVLMALREAVQTRGGPGSLICHTDNGSPYVSRTVKKYLKDHGICPSYSRAHVPYDNSPLESFNKTLKTEELYRRIYTSENEFLSSVYKFRQYYNEERPHRTLKNRTPADFEEQYFLKIKQ